MKKPPNARAAESSLNETQRALRLFVKDYSYIYLGLGLIGNTSFFVGSVLFLWESTKTYGVWLFIIGSFGMLIGSIGDVIVKYLKKKDGL